MKRNFVQVAQFLEMQFPELQGRIQGGNFPPPPVIEFLTKLLTILQLVGMAWMMMGGDKLLRLLRLVDANARQMPAYYYTIQQHLVQIGILLYLLMPQILGKFTINGAFELYLDNNENLIWSKLQEGRFPTQTELIQMMVAAGLKQHTAAA